MTLYEAINENERLKAENERLKAAVFELEAYKAAFLLPRQDAQDRLPDYYRKADAVCGPMIQQ